MSGTNRFLEQTLHKLREAPVSDVRAFYARYDPILKSKTLEKGHDLGLIAINNIKIGNRPKRPFPFSLDENSRLPGFLFAFTQEGFPVVTVGDLASHPLLESCGFELSVTDITEANYFDFSENTRDVLPIDRLPGIEIDFLPSKTTPVFAA